VDEASVRFGGMPIAPGTRDEVRGKEPAKPKAVIPAKAGTQYAATPRLYHRRLRLLDPRLRGDDNSAG
jgi:hypothetical protein